MPVRVLAATAVVVVRGVAAAAGAAGAPAAVAGHRRVAPVRRQLDDGCGKMAGKTTVRTTRDRSRPRTADTARDRSTRRLWRVDGRASTTCGDRGRTRTDAKKKSRKRVTYVRELLWHTGGGRARDSLTACARGRATDATLANGLYARAPREHRAEFSVLRKNACGATVLVLVGVVVVVVRRQSWSA